MAWMSDWTWREYREAFEAYGIAALYVPHEPDGEARPVPLEAFRDAERSQMSQPGRRAGRTLAVQYDLGQVMIDRLAALRHEVIAHTNDTVIPNDGHPERHYIVLMALAQYAAVLAWFWEHEPDSYPPERRQRPDQMRVMGWHVFPSEAVQTWCGFELVPMAPEEYVEQQGQCDTPEAIWQRVTIEDRPLTATEIMQRRGGVSPMEQVLPDVQALNYLGQAMQTEAPPRCVLCRQTFTAWVEVSTHLVFGGCPAQSRGQRLVPQGVTDHGEPTYDAMDAAGELGGMTLDEWSAWLDREERETP